MATRPLDQRVTALEETVAGLQHLPNKLASFRSEISVRFEQMDARFDKIDARFEQIDVRFSEVDGRFDTLERLVREENERFHARMRMLHEELIDRIRIGREGPGGDEPDGPRQPRRRPKR